MLTHNKPGKRLTTVIQNGRNAYYGKSVCTAQICSIKKCLLGCLTAIWAGGARQWCQLATCRRSGLALSVQRETSLFVTGWNKIWRSHTFMIIRHAEPYLRLQLMKYNSLLQFWHARWSPCTIQYINWPLWHFTRSIDPLRRQTG
jgi:hypothetical protein